MSFTIKSSIVIVFFSQFCSISHASPIINVALAPPEGSNTAFDTFSTQQARTEAQGLGKITDAMNKALGTAKSKIDAAIAAAGRSSFLAVKSESDSKFFGFGGDSKKDTKSSEPSDSSNTIFIRVHEGPSSLSVNRAEKLESMRNNLESKEIVQAAAEFDTLTDTVVAELKRSLQNAGAKGRRSSFLQANSDHIDVRVAASKIAWPSTVGMLRGTESGRNMNERSFNNKVLELQKLFLKKLNSMISTKLGL